MDTKIRKKRTKRICATERAKRFAFIAYSHRARRYKRERPVSPVNPSRNPACFKIASWRIPRFDDFLSKAVGAMHASRTHRRTVSRAFSAKQYAREEWGKGALFRNTKESSLPLSPLGFLPLYDDVTSRIVIHPLHLRRR